MLKNTYRSQTRPSPGRPSLCLVSAIICHQQAQHCLLCSPRYYTRVFRLWNWLFSWCLAPWINHLPPVCYPWNTVLNDSLSVVWHSEDFFFFSSGDFFQGISWSNAGLLLILPRRKKFQWNWMEIQHFSFKKMNWNIVCNMSTILFRP